MDLEFQDVFIYDFFSQRAFAALAAIWERLRGLSASALASASLESSQTSQGNGVGIFGWIYWRRLQRWFSLWSLAGCLKDDLESSLVWIARTRITYF